MYEVEEKKITNKQIREQIDIAEIDDLIAKRQLNWLGKIARMDENKLPLKMLSCWCPEPRPHHRPKITVRNSLVKALLRVDPELSPKGILAEFWEQAKDPSQWSEKCAKIENTRAFFPD
jgi:hypothetical protein